MDDRVSRAITKRNQEEALAAAQEEEILSGNDLTRTLATRERDLQEQTDGMEGDQ